MNRDAGTPDTEAEKYLAGIWSELLGMDDLYLNDTFFDIGGHSLLVMKVITAVHQKTGVKLSPQDFLVSTLEQMAGRIETEYTFESSSAVEAVTAEAATEVAQENEPEAALAEAKTAEATEAETKGSGAFRIIKGFWK